MNTKTILIFAIVCTIQAIHAETVEEVLKEYEPTIQNLKTRIETTTNDFAGKLGLAKANLEKNISAARKYVNEQLSVLGKAVEQAGNEAAETGRDIIRCILAEKQAVALLNINQFNQCRSVPEFVTLFNEISNLRSLVFDVVDIGEVCTKQFPEDTQTADLRKCIDGELSRLEKVSADQATIVTQGLENVNTVSQACIVQTSNNLEDAINNISSDFQKCVSAV